MSARTVFAGALVVSLAIAGCKLIEPAPQVDVPPAPVTSVYAPIEEPAPPPAVVAPQPIPDPPLVKPPQAQPADELNRVLAYFSEIRKRSNADLGRDHAYARKVFVKNPSEVNRVRLALLLSLPGTSFRDERRAVELLEPMLKELRSEYTPLRGFALLVHSFVAEHVRLDSNTQTLRDKLEALKVLEKSLTERSTQGGSR